MTANTEVEENGILRFRDVTTAEQGGYVCTASNSAGTVSLMALLNVQGIVLLVSVRLCVRMC